METKPIGNAISGLRQQRNMSVTELAEQLGVSQRAVADWESGRTVPDEEQLAAMEELFSVTAEDLAKGNISSHIRVDSTETKQIEQDQDLFKLICRTVALAMGIAVTVLSIMDRMDPQHAITMLGIGLTCLGISAFHKRK